MEKFTWVIIPVMKYRNHFLFVLVCLFFSSCVAKKTLKSDKDELTEAGYYSFFTDATRQALVYNNFKEALVLYGKCITLFPERAAPYYQISNIYLSLNDIKKGKEFAKKAVNLESNNTWYLLHLANIFQYENNLDSLIYIYEKVIKLDSKPEYKYNLSLYYSKKGDVDGSMKLLKDLERELKGTKELLILKHQNFSALNLSDSAIAQLYYLVSLFPDDFENYGLLAEYLSETNQYLKADSIYRQMLKLEPENGLANLSFADHFYKSGKKDSALVYYKKGFLSDDLKIEDKIGLLFNFLYDPVLIKTDSILIENLIATLKHKYADPRPYTLAAEYYVKSQKYGLAVDELKQAIELGSEAYIVWEQYIMINNYLAQHDKVDLIYSKALEKFSKEIKIYIYSGYSLYALGKYEQVISVCEQASTIANINVDDKVQIYNLMADSYRQKLNYHKSDSLYEAILLFDPANLFIRNNYSYYLSLRGENLARAKELSSFTIKKEPRNSTYLDTYGWILFKMGDSQEAIKYIEAAIKNGAYSNSEVLEHYGDIMFDLKRCSEAIEAWNESIKYNSSRKEDLEIKITTAEKACSNKVEE